MKNVYLQCLALGVALLVAGCSSSSGGDGDSSSKAKAVIIYQNIDEATCNQLKSQVISYEEDGVDVDVNYYNTTKECSDYGMTETDYYDSAEGYDGKEDFCSVSSFGGASYGSCVIEATGDASLYYAPSRIKSSAENIR